MCSPRDAETNILAEGGEYGRQSGILGLGRFPNTRLTKHLTRDYGSVPHGFCAEGLSRKESEDTV